MIITVPFTYSAKLLHVRARKPESYILWSEADVMIEEADDSQAPVAVRVPRPNGAQDRLLRWHDGRLWEPIVHGTSNKLYTPLTAEELHEQASTHREARNPLLKGPWEIWMRREPRRRIEDIENVRRVVEDNRPHVIGQVNQAANDLLIIDGIVHQVTPEPVYAIRERSSFDRVEVRIDIDDAPESGRRVTIGKLYRADRFEEAFEAARQLAGLRGWGEDCIARGIQQVEILMPEVLRYDDETPAIMDAARVAMGAVAPKLKDAAKGLVHAYVDLRDAIAARAPVEPDLVYLMQALAREMESDPTLGPVREGFMRALERWSVRPVDVGDEAPSPSTMLGVRP